MNRNDTPLFEGLDDDPFTEANLELRTDNKNMPTDINLLSEGNDSIPDDEDIITEEEQESPDILNNSDSDEDERFFPI